MPGGQAQTPTYLINTLLASAQAGAITPVRMEDLPASFVPWDDPANVQGLSVQRSCDLLPAHMVWCSLVRLFLGTSRVFHNSYC